jgi:hypothetical protein
LAVYAIAIIGLGTVCRRENPAEITRIVNALTSTGLRLHGFGMKSTGLARVSHLLTSADSMAWSTRGRMALAARPFEGVRRPACRVVRELPDMGDAVAFPCCRRPRPVREAA